MDGRWGKVAYDTEGHCLLREHGVVRMPWSAQSPDLIPIENVWRIMKLRISKRRHRIRSIQEMERVLLEEWDKITPAEYRRDISSMPKRIDLVCKNKGSSIKLRIRLNEIVPRPRANKYTRFHRIRLSGC